MRPALESAPENARPARIGTPSVEKNPSPISPCRAVTGSPPVASAATGCREPFAANGTSVDAEAAATPGMPASASTTCLDRTPFRLSTRTVSRGPVRESHLGVARAPVAVDHRGRHDEERDRHGDLEDDERVAPALSDAVGRGDRAQRVGVQPARFVQRRRDAGGDAGRERDDGRLHEDARVDREIEEAVAPAVAKDPRRAARRSRRRRGCRRRSETRSDSVRSERTMRPRLAPIEARMAISCSRAVHCAIIRMATLAQAMRSVSRTAVPRT